MGPGTLMAMQRLAGNRATVQALGRRPMSGSLDTLRPSDEEEQIAGGAGSAGDMASPKQADAAAGPPGGGGPPPGGGDGNPNAVGGSAGTKSGETASGRPDLLKGAGSAANVKSGETASAGQSSLGSAGAGSAANIKSGETASAGQSSLGSAGAGSASNIKSGETATARTDRLLGTDGATMKAGERATATPRSLTGATAGRGVTAGAGGAGPSPVGQAGPAEAPAPAPAPAQAPVPVNPVATGPGGLPDPETASTGIDWNQMLSDWGPPARTVLEVSRLIPGWGLLGGLASDSINFASDIAAIPNSQNADLVTGLIVFRNFTNMGNNAVGHVLYVDQLIQDGLAGSVVAAEFTPVTAAINEVLAGVKVGLDEVQMGTDIIIEVESLYESNHAPSSAEAEQWKALADGYVANILGDTVNVILDVISLSSAGAANTGPVQQARQPLTMAGAFMKNAVPIIISAVNGVLGVWLGSLVTKERHELEGSPTDLRDQSLALDAAGLIVDGEGAQARATYDGINVAVDILSAYAEDQIAQINAVAEALSGGKSAFQLIRDSVQAGLNDMNRKLGMVQQLGASASSAQANAAAISAACASVLGSIDALVMPNVTLPSVDLGDGVMADAAAAVANTAAQAANEAIQAAMSGVSAALETAKDGIRAPVVALQERAVGLGEWLALLAAQCTAMVGTLTAQIAAFSEGLGRCTSVEQVIDLIIGQVSDLTGLPRVTVQEIRDAWNSVGPYIDQFVALGPRMHQRASDLRAQADLLEAGGGAGPEFAPPPGLPPGPPGSPPAKPGANPKANTNPSAVAA